MNRQTKADLAILSVTLAWGCSYFLTDLCLTEVDSFTLNMLRFCSAFLFTLIAAFPKLKTVNVTTLKYAALVGVMLVGAYSCASYGVLYTSISNAGFLCNLTFLFTPVFAFFLRHELPTRKTVFVALFAVVGIGLLSLDDTLKLAIGDIICLFCGLFYAGVLLTVETAVRDERVDAFQLGVFQLGFTGLYCTIVAFLVEQPHLPSSPKVWFAAIFLAVFCTGFALIVQSIAQQYTSANHASIIYCMEPVFSAIVAYFMAGEVLRPRAYLGAVILVLSVLIQDVDFKAMFQKKTPER